MYYFLQGLTLGLAYVAPIGVQNLFVINSAMTQSRRRALLTALIVIFFDVTLALFCFFGIGAAIQKYEKLQMFIRSRSSASSASARRYRNMKSSRCSSSERAAWW